MTPVPPEAIIAADDACLALMETGATAAALVRTALTAALPHIEAAIADRIAARYEFVRKPKRRYDSYTEGLLDGLDIAEQIARGGSDE